jgi:hypothetical protein
VIFRTCGKEYCGATAVEIVNAMREDASESAPQSDTPLPEFLLWSLAKHSNRIPLRELDVSNRLNDETLALNYLYLRAEYGLGELFEVSK